MKFPASYFLACAILLLVGLVPCRSHADEPSRTWRDAGGKFSIEAKLIDVQADKVRLLKTSGETIMVPLAKLSEIDRTYLKNRTDSKTDSPAENDNPFATPSLEKTEAVQATFALQTVNPSQDVADLPGEGTTALLPKSTACEPLTADPANSLPNLKAGLALVTQTDAYDDVSDMVTLNSRQALIAMGIGRDPPAAVSTVEPPGHTLSTPVMMAVGP